MDKKTHFRDALEGALVGFVVGLFILVCILLLGYIINLLLGA